MTPQEKAKELVDRFKKLQVPLYKNSLVGTYMGNDMAIECALIAVEEIRIAINFAWKDLAKLEREDAYWQKVEQEIAILNLPSF
jgi:hypothetical protein